MTSPLDKAILDAGGRDALASKLGVHPNTVRYWQSSSLPLKRARQLAEVTGKPWQDFIPAVSEERS